MPPTRFMSFLLAGLEVAPHSPGSGRAFSWALAFLLVTAGLAVGGCASVPHSVVPLAYVPNEGSGTISIIDTATDTTIGEINTGGKPRGIALSRDGGFMYGSD